MVGKLSGEDRGLALKVCACLFSTMTSVLTKARERERCRRTLFEEVGFLFCCWSNFNVSLDQEKNEFIWNFEGSSGMTVDTITDAEEYIVGKGDREDVEKRNSKLWDELINNNPDLTLMVCYEISVRGESSNTGKKQANEDASDGEHESHLVGSERLVEGAGPASSQSQKGLEGELRKIYRPFNMLDVACHFFRATVAAEFQSPSCVS